MCFTACGRPPPTPPVFNFPFKSTAMKRHKSILPLLGLCVLSALLPSCKKYLEAKSDASITTPSKLEDLEGILNNYSFINCRYPSAPESSADNYYLTTADWNSLAQRQRDFYLWNKTADIGGDYTGPYQIISYANIVLEAEPKMGGEANRKNAVRGQALFVRGSYHFALAQLFAGPYDAGTAGNSPGIPVRTTAAIEAPVSRASIAETYDAILTDLKQAAALLPPVSPVKYQPGKAAAFGLLSRIYLSMRDYRQSGRYADSCLALYSTLLDYNTLSAAADIPFAQFNAEVIYDARSLPPPTLQQSRAKIDTTLYRSYANNDLRKTLFYQANADGSQAYKGNYSGTSAPTLFTGIATDEVLLNKAECAARNGDIPTAQQSLNTLLAKRWKSGTFLPVTESDPKKLLNSLLTERRKELVFRSIRWTDLRRLNKDSETAQVLYRNINGQTSRLEPGAARFTFLLDQNAVRISGLEQNP